MHTVPGWKRAIGAVLLLALSAWLAAMGLQTIRVTCENGQCVHAISYAGITSKETAFTPTPDTVTWRRTGKNNNQGVVVIHAPAGKVEVDWLTPHEAETAAHEMVRDPSYALSSGGPRWWLFFLLATIPALIEVIRPRAPRLPETRTSAPPIEQSKKAARAARGKAKKARERARR